MVLTELDRGATLRAAEQIVTLFQIFQDELFSQVLFLWWNASFLYTLLAQGTEPPLPMGLGLLCQRGRTARCLEALFRWYSDPVISLGDGPERFLVQLGQRADEPLLIRDGLCSDKNEAALLQVLASGFVPEENQADVSLPLRAPVTLLSEGSLFGTGIGWRRRCMESQRKRPPDHHRPERPGKKLQTVRYDSSAKHPRRTYHYPGRLGRVWPGRYWQTCRLAA